MVNKSCYYYEYKSTHFCLLLKKDITECQPHCKYFEMVSASPAFLNHMDKLFINAMKLEREEGYEDIVMHATSLYFVSKNADGNEIIVSPQEFAEIIKSFYDKNIPNIRLISCSAGYFDNGAVQQLSEALGVKVKAPIGIAAIDFDGNLTIHDPISDEVIPTSKAWKTFSPKKEV